MTSSNYSSFWPPLAIFFTALTLRLIHLVEIDFSLFSHHLIGDETTHLLWYKALCQGEYSSLTPYFRAPLYGLFMHLFTGLEDNFLLYIRYSQFFLGSLTCLLTYFLAKELFNEKVALLSGAVVAIYPPLIFFEGTLLIVTLFTFLIVLYLCLFSFFLKRQKKRYLYFASLAFSLAIITRPTLLPFLPFHLLIVTFNLKKQWSTLLLSSTLLCLPLLIPIYLNYQGTGQFIWLSSQGGINFYAGNSNTSDGIIPLCPSLPTTPDKWHKANEQLKDSPWKNDNIWATNQIFPNHVLKKQTTSKEQNKFWYEKTFSEIKKEPFRAIKHLLSKALFLFSGKEWINNFDLNYTIKHYFPFLSILHKVFNLNALLLFLLPGLLFCKSSKPLWFLKCFFFTFSITLIMFFVNARFRIPIIPIITIFASYGFIEVFNLFKNNNLSTSLKNKYFIFSLISLLISQSFHFYPESSSYKAARALFHNTLADGEMREKNLLKAKRENQLSLDLNTREHYIFLTTRANIEWYLEGNHEQAIKSLHKAYNEHPHPQIKTKIEKWKQFIASKT